jgi:uncharacterized protein
MALTSHFDHLPQLLYGIEHSFSLLAEALNPVDNPIEYANAAAAGLIPDGHEGVHAFWRPIASNGYEVIVTSILGAFIAQMLKFIGLLAFKRRFNFRILVETGGMPSSHSSSMTSLATSVGLIDGFTSTTFAIAVGIALVVMYDAAGVRRAAGRMAGVLNRLSKEIYTHDKGHVPERLKELLGHTPFEVLVGGILGVVFAYYFHGVING